MPQNDEELEPLDPVMERVRKKMVRLLVISIGIMMIGLMAVLGAIVYKISNPDKPSAVAEIEAINQDTQEVVGETVIDLPFEARVVSHKVSGDRMVLEIRLSDGNREFVIVNLRTGKMQTKLSFE